jgi:hypothetical protein
MKINSPKNIRLFKIPQETDFVLFLIQEELKSRRLIKELENAGFDSMSRSSDFSSVIFATLGFKNKSVSFYEWYKDQIDVFCKEVNLSEGDSLSKQAFDFYVHLMLEKRGQVENK